jgi:hypothetical protein
MRNLWVTLAVAASASAVMVFGEPNGKAGLNQAAALYQQARYDSSLARLEALKSSGPWKRRDSLSLFQYLGMASAKLGRDSAAVAYFSDLLRIDSLFQFPRNEDSLILNDFGRARESRSPAASATASAKTAPATIGPKDTATAFAKTIRDDLAEPLPIAPGNPRAFAPPTAAASAASPMAANRKIGLAFGALPLGTGWMARDRVKSGLALGFLQAGGALFSVYASNAQTQSRSDNHGIRDHDQLASIKQWQWVQGISLSTALGAYLFSLIASAGD